MGGNARLCGVVHSLSWRSSMAHQSWFVAGIALITASTIAGPATAETPLPWKSATVTWTSTSPAPGVEVRTGSISVPQAHLVWTVAVQAPAVNRLTGAATWAELGDARSGARTVARPLAAAGLRRTPGPGAVACRLHRHSARHRGLPRTGRRLRRPGRRAAPGDRGHGRRSAPGRRMDRVRRRPGAGPGKRPRRDRGPARFHGSVVADHGGAVAGRSTTSAQARAAGSVLAVNGGFFITSDADGVQGTQSGTRRLPRHALERAVRRRPGRPDPGPPQPRREPRLPALTSATAGRPSRSTASTGCRARSATAGRPGVSPTEVAASGLPPAPAPMSLATCSRRTSARTCPREPGRRPSSTTAGRVVAVGAAGGTVPAGGEVLQGIGTAATWAPDARRRRTAADRGRTGPRLFGRAVPLTGKTGIVSAGPILVRDGRLSIDAATEGVVDPADLSFGYAWAEQRQPRTLAGTDSVGGSSWSRSTAASRASAKARRCRRRRS